MIIVKPPLEYLRSILARYTDEKKYLEQQIADLDTQREDLMKRFKEVGLSIIEFKTTISKLEGLDAKEKEPVKET